MGGESMRHDWKQTKYEPGYKEETCTRCGAKRHDCNLYIKYAGRWTPAMLDGKRQPYCCALFSGEGKGGEA